FPACCLSGVERSVSNCLPRRGTKWTLREVNRFSDQSTAGVDDDNRIIGICARQPLIDDRLRWKRPANLVRKLRWVRPHPTEGNRGLRELAARPIIVARRHQHT